MRRRDFYYDPAAPEPQSLIPAVTVGVSNDKNEVLLIEREDSGLWSLPGGTMDIGERAPDAAVREVFEETAVEVRISGLVGIYSDPGHVITYTNGTPRQEFSICFRAVQISGSPIADEDEVTGAAWFSFGSTMELPMHGSMRVRINDYFSAKETPYFR